MWVAAAINPYGTPARVVEAVMNDQVIAVATPHLLDELEAVLVRPKFRRWITLADAVASVATPRGKADLHPEPGQPSASVRDPDDVYLVALAEATGATLVSDDDDLLSANLKPPAITPRQLLDKIADSQ